MGTKSYRKGAFRPRGKRGFPVSATGAPAYDPRVRPLAVGAKAPDFRLRDAVRGGDYALGDLLARGPLLLKFLRGTWCPNCRADLERTCERQGDIQRAGLQAAFVVCQNPFNAVSHFARLPDAKRPALPVLVDADRSTARAYGVYVPFKWDSFRIARPAAFGIGLDRRIIYAHAGSSQWDRAPLEAALAALGVPAKQS